jgi:uncharacterized membrane protein YoaK (UPF0700 family)
MNEASREKAGTIAVLLAMTAATGIVDTVSLLASGHVFTAHMTGNVLFLVFALAGAKGFSIPRLSAALIAFCLVRRREGDWQPE